MYDCSNRESFDNLTTWLNELDTYATKKNIVRMLVGNKIDKVCVSSTALFVLMNK